jgi:hypothetical protein
LSLPFVTDHALLRYLERARGINIELIREHLSLICAPAAAVGAAYLRRDGVRYVFKGGHVVTVLTDTGSVIPNATHQQREASA